MADDIASLGVRIDASEIEQGKKALDDLAQAGGRAEQSTQKLTAAQKALVDAQKSGGGITAKMVQDAGGWAQAEKVLASSLGQSAGALAARTSAATSAASGVERAAKGAEGLAKGYNLAEHAGAGVTRELVVLAREAGRGAGLTNILGSVSLLTQRLGLMTPAVIGAGLAVGAVVAPMAAASLAGLKFADTMQKLTDVASGVGTAMGLTGDKLEAAAEAGARAAGISAGAAEAQAVAYAQTGRIGVDVLTGLISVTEQYARATGEKPKPSCSRS
jgi:hypothetical protein